MSVGQIILDAQRMANRIKDLDTLGSALLVEAEGNNRLVESLRQFQDEMDSLNRISNNKSNVEMINRIQQQNANSSEILKENRELKICIEDYERAMEMIMHKYREHTTNKVFDSKINFKDAYNERLWNIIKEQREKINEMAAVMHRAATVDDDAINRELETMTRLRLENKTLRELVQFGATNHTLRCTERMEEKAIQTETADDSNDELSLSGESIENVNNNSVDQLNLSVASAASDASCITTVARSANDSNSNLPNACTAAETAISNDGGSSSVTASNDESLKTGAVPVSTAAAVDETMAAT